MVYGFFFFGGFSQKQTYLGDATVSGCPSSTMEKVILTTDAQHMEAISTGLEACGGEETVSRLVHTNIYIKLHGCIKHSDDTQRTGWVGANACVTWTWSVFDVCERSSCYFLPDS